MTGVFFVSNTSIDPGFNQGEWSFVGKGFNTSQFYGVDKRPGANRYIGGLQDNSTVISPEGKSAALDTKVQSGVWR